MALALVGVIAAAPALAALTWESIGPEGGDRYMLRISPCSPSTLFLAGHSAIHRSIDGGENWTLTIDPRMAGDSFLDIAFAESGCGALYAAGAETGVWYSPDSGATWQPRSQGLPSDATGIFPVTSLVVDGEGTLFAGLSSTPDGAPPPRLIYRSRDGGLSWTADGFGIPALWGTTKIVTLLSVDAAGRPWAAVYGAGVYQYGNGTWQDRNGDLPGNAALATFLAHDPTDPERLLLGTETAWVFETRDGGQSWARLPLPEALAAAPVLPLVYTVAIDPSNARFILVRANEASGSLEHPLFRPDPAQTEGGGLYISADAGASWIRKRLFLFRIVADPSQVVSDEVPGEGTVVRSRNWYLTAGGKNSVLKSSDGLTTFEPKTAGMRTLWVNDLWVHPHPPSGHARMLFAASEAGLFRMSDDPANGWSYTDSSDSAVYTWSFAEDFAHPDSVLYATGNPAWSTPQWQGVFRLPLSCFDAPCPPADRQLLSSIGFWRVVTSPAVPGRIVAAGQREGVLISDDEGASWRPLHDGMTMPASVTDVVLDAAGEPRWASFRTYDGDPEAPPASPEPGGVYAFDAQTRRWGRMAGISTAVFRLRALTDGSLLAAAADGIYRFRSADGWQRISPVTGFGDVAVEPARPAYIYGATRAGVWRTTDGGAHWHDLSTGLPVRYVDALAFDATDGTVYAAVEGGSVHRLLRDPSPRPVVFPSVGSLDFGRVPVGFKKRIGITLTNVGEADLVIQALTPTHAAFTVEGIASWPITITPGSWVDLKLAFTPSLVDRAAGNVVVSGNGTNTPLPLAVQGQGYSETGTVSLTVDPANASWIATTPWGSTIARTGKATLRNVPTGFYVIEWRPLAGYTLPAVQPAIFEVKTGQATKVTGTYIKGGTDGAPPPSDGGTGASKTPVSGSN